MRQQKFGIGIHDSVIGVWLPSDEKVAQALGSNAALHKGLHTRKYYDAVDAAISARALGKKHFRSYVTFGTSYSAEATRDQNLSTGIDRWL